MVLEIPMPETSDGKAGDGKARPITKLVSNSTTAAKVTVMASTP